MSNNKKDLTRIEDLGEFIHELNEDEETTSFDDFPSDVPDLPSSEENSDSLDFGSSDDASSFETSFESEEESTSDFGSSFESGEGEAITDPVSETDFTTSDFGTSFTDETPAWSTPETIQEAATNWDAPKEEVTEEVLEKMAEPQWDAPIEEITPSPVYTPPEKEYKTPETFEDLKKFSESSSFSGMATEGNPSFSVLIKNVRYIEDVNDIISLMRELNLLSDSEEQTRGRLMRGMLLVPRISEYAAIFLAHKLRRFDIDIQIGLSDEIHPPKHQETPETGIVSKFNLYQNQGHHFQFDDPKLDISQIILSATPSLEGYQILRYMGVASEHKMLDTHIVEDPESTEVPRHYQELALKLKAHALKAHSNAVIGLNYQLTPIGHKYRLTCTGNLVWINKL